MKASEYDILKARFLKAYANVPVPLRGEIIAVAGDETLTWATARAEVLHDTEKAKEVLKQLKNIGVI